MKPCIVVKQGTTSLREMNEVMEALDRALDDAFPDRTLDLRAVAFGYTANALGLFKTVNAENAKVLMHALVDSIDLERLQPIDHPQSPGSG